VTRFIKNAYYVYSQVCIYEGLERTATGSGGIFRGVALLDKTIEEMHTIIYVSRSVAKSFKIF